MNRQDTHDHGFCREKNASFYFYPILLSTQEIMNCVRWQKLMMAFHLDILALLSLGFIYCLVICRKLTNVTLGLGVLITLQALDAVFFSFYIT